MFKSRKVKYLVEGYSMSALRKNIVDQCCYILQQEGWSRTESAIKTIVDTSFENKEKLREMLSRHPEWDNDTMRIIVPVETNGERLDVPEKMDGFRYMCHRVSAAIDVSPLEIFESVLIRGGVVTSEDCDALHSAGYNGGKKGQKIGRAINAWAVSCGVNIHKEYNWRFNALINGGLNTTDRIAILSLNPVDFFMASHGAFDSCHSIDRDGDHAYRSGNLSYMMDGTTMVFFTVDPNKSADYPTNRIDRIFYHFDSGLLIQGRLYTETKEDIHAVSRAMVCKIIANCLNVPNLWLKHTKIDTDRVESVGNNYPDYINNAKECVMCTLQGSETSEKIRIGCTALCISCGGFNHESNVLDCCESDGCLECENCHDSVYGDDAIWDGDYVYCENCVEYCDHCDSYKLKYDVREVGRKKVCDDCLEEDFVKCVSCDEYVKKDNAYTHSDNSYCEDCFHDEYAMCDECEEYFCREDLLETENGMLCQECYDAKVAKQSLKLAIV